ncbi:hypothetical protein [Acinetobacter calcoaceticus]|uniref:hypothetical protein n=1 Tax=Acinetobacter calcoaceticus TaxID=471 RepID=UPI0005EFAF23|nr:hypothetical protein [Acinetobacter calcoaceticus]
MFNITADKELVFALEMAKRAMYATNINGMNTNNFTQNEIDENLHAYRIAVEYVSQIKGYIDYVLYNQITVINDEFDIAIQELNRYVFQIKGIVSNLVVANEVLSFIEKIILVLAKV